MAAPKNTIVAKPAPKPMVAPASAAARIAPSFAAELLPADSTGVLPITQRLTLTLDGKVIAHARWFAPASDDGVFQLLELFVDPLHQRQGHGSRLLRQTYEHATGTLKSLGIKPRRIWVAVEQKRHVIARAFFSKHGFQHVATMQKLYIDQDAMIYSRSFD